MNWEEASIIFLLQVLLNNYPYSILFLFICTDEEMENSHAQNTNKT